MSLKNKITYISLFSGCGGFDIGFKENGFKCLGAYDINPYVTDVHSKNLKGPVFVHDLNDLNLPGNLPKDIDVVIAGSPCQGFSTIGKRMVNDPRNHLLLTGGEIAIKYNAKAFICENVPGSNSGEHKKYWEKLQHLLKSNGYITEMIQYSAYSFGVPQLRKRLILYAWKSDEHTTIELLSVPQKNIVLKDILHGLENQQNHNINFIEDKDEIHYAIGMAYQDWGKFNEAIEFYKRAIDFNLHNEDALYELAYCMDIVGQLDQSIAYY
ncbi:MAG: DNA (cytosine-5-)-methyltransferase, partial [Sphingobacteriales bacterium]